MPSEDHEFITTMLDYFSAYEEWLPDWIDWLSHIVLGEIPLAKANDVYDLADQWERLATELNDVYLDVQKAADPILNNWAGDASASAFVEQWYAYLEGLRGTADGAAQMRAGVQGFGLEVELMKYMVAINLLMLAISIYMLVVAAIPSGGASLGGAPPLFFGFRTALGRLAENTIGRIASIVVRFAIKPLTNLFLKLPANVATRALAAGARFAVPLVTRITLGHAIPAGVVKALVLDGAKRIAETWAGKIVTNIAARGVSKAVANRLAAQALRGMAGEQIRGRLASQTARAVQKQLVKEIQQQLMKNWAGKKIGSEVAETVLTKTAIEEAAKVGLGKEFAHYIGSRVAFGAGFMGGGDLGAQLLQMSSGNRDSLDWAHIQNSAVQGGVFGASMFGGPVGHTVGGALAGGSMGIVGQLGSGEKFSWTEVGHQTLLGASAGVIFGGQTHLEMSTLGGGKLTIGKDLHLLSGEDGGFSAVSTRFNKGEGLQEHLVLTSDGHVAWQGANPSGEAGGLRVLPDEVSARPEVADHIRSEWSNDSATVMTQSPSASGGNAATAPRPEASASPAPARSDGGGGGGGGGGGPRQTGDGGPRQTGGGDGGGGGTPARSGEAGPTAAGDGARSAVASDHTGGDVSSGGGTSSEAPATGRAADGTSGASASDHVAADSSRDSVSPETASPRPDSGTTSAAHPDASAVHHGADGPIAPDRGAEPGHESGTDHIVPSESGRPGGDGPPPGGERATSGDGVSHTGADTPPTAERAPVGGDRVPAGADRVPTGHDQAPVGGDRTPVGSDRPHTPDHTVDRPSSDRPSSDRPSSDGAADHGRGDGRRDDIAPVGQPAETASRVDVDNSAGRGDLGTGDHRAAEHLADQAGDRRPSGGEHGAETGLREGGDGNPPHDGPPHDPTGARPDEASHSMRDAGAEVGEPATPESIRQGTVRMELHPDFPQVVEFLDRHGFRLVEDPAEARAVQRDVYDSSGRNLLRTEREVRHLDGMRFLDLEHEVDHVRQLVDRLEGKIATEAVRERPGNIPKRIENAQGVLSLAHDKVVEYHVRLQEFIRLAERDVDSSLLAAHAKGVETARGEYNRAVSGQGNKRRADWAREYFPEIPELRRQYESLQVDRGVDPTSTRASLELRDGRPMSKAPIGDRNDVPARVRTSADAIAQPDRSAAGGGRNGESGVSRSDVESGPEAPGRGDLARGGDVRRVEDFRLVPVEGASAPERPVTLPEDVETVADREIGGLIEGREPGAPDLPHKANFDQESGTIRVRYGDGVELDVSVQVNESLPPGGTVVRRPAMEELADGTWRQADTAAIGLSPHVPAEPGARAPYVRDNLDNAWRTLHGEVGEQLRPPAGEAGPAPHDRTPSGPVQDSAPFSEAAQARDSAGPRDGAPPDGGERRTGPFAQARRDVPADGLRGLEELGGPEIGIRDHDGVVRHAAEPAEPALPKPLSSAEIQAIMRGRLPEQLGRWAHEHLADPSEHGQARPKASDEVTERLRVLGDESVDRVTPRGWEEPASRFPELEALEPGNSQHGGPARHESETGSNPRDRESGPVAREHEGVAPHERDSAAPGDRDGAASRDRDGDGAASRERDGDGDGTGPRERDGDGDGVAPRERDGDGAAPHERDEGSGHEPGGAHDGDSVGERPRAVDKPPIEDMIPRGDLTPEQRAQVEAGIERSFQESLDGQRFGGLEVRVSYAEVSRDYVRIEMSVREPGADHGIGKISRIFMREPNGELVVSHDSLKLNPEYQGRGFASEFNRHMEGWYRESGVSYVKVVTSWTGGYTWGKAGFEWQLGGGHKVFTKLNVEIREIGRHLSNLDHYAAEDLRPLYSKYGGDTPTELSQNMRMQRHEAQNLVDRAAGAMDGSLPKHEYPTPREVADLGYRESVHGQGTSVDRAGAHWVGKDAMVDTMWHGRRYLDGAPPAEYLGYEPGLRAEPAGGTTHTASGIEHTGFVPDGRAGHLPDVTVAEMHAATDNVGGHDFSGRDIVGVTSDGTHVRVEMADGSNRHFVTEIGHDMETLGRTEVRAGTPQDPHVVTVNHRVAPEQLSRVWVHEITETLAIQHTEPAGRPPQGLLRRATASIGRAFGFGDGPARPPVDPHVSARINERVHLERQFRDATGDRVEQNRLRNEIAGVERDLQSLGHRVAPSLVHQLANALPAGGLLGGSHHAPTVHSPHEPGVPHDPAAPSVPDGARLVDPPWQPGETPAVHNLIPHTPEQAARWQGAIREAVIEKFEGRTYGDKHVRVGDVKVDAHSVRVELTIHDENGTKVGWSNRVFARHPEEGYVYAKNQSLYMNDNVQGGGFAREYNDHLERWYRESDVKYVEVSTAEVGGYAWARQGFSWGEWGGGNPISRLGAEGRQIGEVLRGLDDLDAEGLRPLYDKYGGDTPEQLRTNMERQRSEALEIDNRRQAISAGRRPVSDWPTTAEVLAVGNRGEHGPNAHWVGKDALLDSSWTGYRHLDRVPGPGPEHVAPPPGEAVHGRQPGELSLRDEDFSGMPDSRPEESGSPAEDGPPRTDEGGRPGGDEGAAPRPGEGEAPRSDAGGLPRSDENTPSRVDEDVPRRVDDSVPQADEDTPLRVEDSAPPRADEGGLSRADHGIPSADGAPRGENLPHGENPPPHAESGPPRGDESAPPRGGERRRTEPLHLLAFDDVPDGPMQRGTLRDLAGALGEGGDRVAIRAPGMEAGELGPNLRGIPADPIAGVTGRISPLLRPDHLPADTDVVVGYGQTAGVAEARRDAYPDARVVQIVDTVPTDPAHLDVLSRADLVIAVGPEVAGGLRTAFERHGADPVPPVREVVPPVDAGGPPPPVREPGRDGYHVLVTGDERAQLAGAETVRELRAQGVDARLTIAVRDADGPEGRWHQDRLSEVAGSEVTVRQLPDDVAGRRELLHDADVVLDPVARAELDPVVLQATGDGVPVLAHAESGAGRLLGDPLRVSDEHGGGSVVRDGGDAAGWADHLRRTFDDLPAERDRAMSLRHEMQERYGREAAARSVHDAIHDLGEGVARVGDERFRDTLDAREVVRRNAAHDAPVDPDAIRVMTVCTEYDSNAGGVITANRELSQSFRTDGAEVFGRVSLVSAKEPHLVRLETGEGIHVRGVHDVWGVLDEKGQPDRRAMSMLLDNLPADVDVIVANSRFGGGAARILQEHVYPEAKYVHVLHTSPEVLDGVRGKPGEGLDRAATERELMTGADLVTGIGPLLGQEAARLAAGVPGETPPAHTIISDMPRDAGPAPSRTPGDRYEVHVRGRADDTIKGVEMAARMVRDLRAEGLDVHLTVRGAPDGVGPRMAERLSEIAGHPVEVREFVPSGTEEGRAQLRQDLVDADLVLMPSIQDGFGLVASEAAQAGVPVVVGEGTGAGMFFGDERYVPEHLGEAATVRDGNTVAALRDRVDRVAGDAEVLPDHVVDGVLRDVDEARLPAWTDHVRSALHRLDEQYTRAAELRDHIASEHPPGSAAHGVLAVLRGEAAPDPAYVPHTGEGDQVSVEPPAAADHAVPENRVLPEGPEGLDGPEDPRHNASPIEETEFVPDGRPEDVPDVSVSELHDAARQVDGADFSEGTVHAVDVEGDLVRVTMTDGEVRHFRTEVGRDMPNLAETTVRDGTPERPHLVKVNSRVAGDQLTRVWVHEITETLAMKHAEQVRPHEHGLIRRPAEAIAAHYGEGRPVDPHTAARINERVHLERRLEAAEGNPELQQRLRNEIAGVERDLVELGHAPDPPGHWAQRPERPPNLHELIESAGGDGHWSDAARAELAGQLDGHRFGDGVLRLEGPDAIRSGPDELAIRFRVEAPDGTRLGAETRVITREPDGSLVAHHEGRSGHPRFDRQMLEFYREAGVDRVEVTAAGRDGYELARDGYGWARDTDPAHVGRILDEVGRRADEIDGLLDGLRDGTADEAALRERFGGGTREETRANLEREVRDARELLDRAGEHELGDPEFPSPREIAQTGTADGYHRGSTSLGEEVMSRQEWPAELSLSELGDGASAPARSSGARPGEAPGTRFRDSELKWNGARDKFGRRLLDGPDQKRHFPGDRTGTSRGADGQLRDRNGYIKDDNPQPLPGLQARAVPDPPGTHHYQGRPGDGLEGAIHDQVGVRDGIHKEYTDLWNNELTDLGRLLAAHHIELGDRKHFGLERFEDLVDEAGQVLDPEDVEALRTAGARYLELDLALNGASEKLGGLGGDIVRERQFPGSRQLTGPEGDERGRPNNLDRILLYDDPVHGPVLVAIEEKGAGSTLGSRGVEDPSNLGGEWITAEQCSPEYLRHMLQHDVKLNAYLEKNPHMRPVLEGIISSEREGSLRYLQVHVDDKGHVTATDYLLSHDRLRPGSIRLVGE